MTIKTGLSIEWSEAPDHYEYLSRRVKQEVGNTIKNISFRYKTDKGHVTVHNKFITVTVHEDGRIEIKPHEQTGDLL